MRHIGYACLYQQSGDNSGFGTLSRMFTPTQVAFLLLPKQRNSSDPGDTYHSIRSMRQIRVPYHYRPGQSTYLSQASGPLVQESLPSLLADVATVSSVACRCCVGVVIGRGCNCRVSGHGRRGPWCTGLRGRRSRVLVETCGPLRQALPRRIAR